MKVSEEELFQAISRRRSVRNYSMENLGSEELSNIRSLLKNPKKFDSDVSTEAHLIADGRGFKQDISGIIGSYGKVESPHYLILTAETGRCGYLEIGYRYEYVVLALTVRDIATCWIGKGFRGAADNYIDIPQDQEPRALVALGFTPEKDSLSEIEKPKRKELEYFLVNKNPNELDDRTKEAVDCLRRAPSSLNSQPWRVIVEGKDIHLYLKTRNSLVRSLASQVVDMNQIDGGIGLCHLKVAGDHLWDRAVLREAGHPEVKGLSYVATMVAG